jgi:hypothetical protein
MLIIAYAELGRGLFGLNKDMSFTVEPASYRVTLLSKMRSKTPIWAPLALGPRDLSGFMKATLFYLILSIQYVTYVTDYSVYTAAASILNTSKKSYPRNRPWKPIGL